MAAQTYTKFPQSVNHRRASARCGLESVNGQVQQGGSSGLGQQTPRITNDTPQSKGDHDVSEEHEDSATGPSEPSYPPVSSMDHVAGYENVDSEGGSLIPPPVHAQATAPDPEQSSNLQPNIPTITEEVARRALFDEVYDHCCYGTGAAENLVITNIQSSSAFHYELETFTEGRKTSWAFEPFTGQTIDGPENGQAPSAWDIAVQPSRMFFDHQKSYEVPHTASVKTCINCNGEGMNRCWQCLGRGIVICVNCNGNGCHVQVMQHYITDQNGNSDSHSHLQVVPCLSCNCTGKIICYTCGGSGLLECEVCDTNGQLKCFIKLTVTWTTHKNDHVVERTALPDQLIRGAQGQQAFSDQRQRVIPVMTFPDRAVNEASQQLIHAHSISFHNEMILMQRHWIRIVPVSEVYCDYKGKSFSYWVYGYENRVFNPDYPQQCCWGCTLL